MCLRWTAAGTLEAEQQFRKLIGYRDLATLVIAIERHALLTAVPKKVNRPETPGDRYRLTVRGSPPKFHDDPDILPKPWRGTAWRARQGAEMSALKQSENRL